MELQFDKSVMPCLRSVIHQVQNLEQTQEVKLTEGMPDIGRILASWGQLLIRGKEWRSGGMSVSGGVMAWVLYAPENGTSPRTLDTWIPFQMKWSLPEGTREGEMRAEGLLRSLDARSVSPRKIMLRAGISALICLISPEVSSRARTTRLAPRRAYALTAAELTALA